MTVTRELKWVKEQRDHALEVATKFAPYQYVQQQKLD